MRKRVERRHCKAASSVTQASPAHRIRFRPGKLSARREPRRGARVPVTGPTIEHAAPPDRRRCDVYTPPSHRRQGYATALVRALSGHCLAEGRALLPVHRSCKPHIELYPSESRVPSHSRLRGHRLRSDRVGVMAERRTYLRPLKHSDRAMFVGMAQESRRSHAPWVSAPSTPAAGVRHRFHGREADGELKGARECVDSRCGRSNPKRSCIHTLRKKRRNQIRETSDGRQ